MSGKVRMASIILGVVGGSIDVIVGFSAAFDSSRIGSAIGSAGGTSGASVGGLVLLGGLLIIIFGAAGIAGAIVSRKRTSLGGVMMVAAGLLNFLPRFGWAIVAGMALIAGGVFAMAGSGEQKAGGARAVSAQASGESGETGEER